MRASSWNFNHSGVGGVWRVATSARESKERRRLGVHFASPCIAQYVLEAADEARCEDWLATRFYYCTYCMARATTGAHPSFSVHAWEPAWWVCAVQRYRGLPCLAAAPKRTQACAQVQLSSRRLYHWRTPGTTSSRGRREGEITRAPSQVSEDGDGLSYCTL